MKSNGNCREVFRMGLHSGTDSYRESDGSRVTFAIGQGRERKVSSILILFREMKCTGAEYKLENFCVPASGRRPVMTT